MGTPDLWPAGQKYGRPGLNNECLKYGVSGGTED